MRGHYPDFDVCEPIFIILSPINMQRYLWTFALQGWFQYLLLSVHKRNNFYSKTVVTALLILFYPEYNRPSG